MRSVTLILIALLVAATQASVAGKWHVSAEAARKRTDDGGSVSRNAQEFLLDVGVDGATATGTLTPMNGRGSPWTLSGSWQQNRLELASAWREIPITKDGKPATAKARYLVRMTLAGSTLGGTCEFAMENSEPLPQPCVGRRE
jgi:hypothetical protein